MFQIALRSEAYLCKTKIDAEESKKIWIDSLKKYTRGSINMNLFISQKKKKKKYPGFWIKCLPCELTLCEAGTAGEEINAGQFISNWNLCYT